MRELQIGTNTLQLERGDVTTLAVDAIVSDRDPAVDATALGDLATNQGAA